MLCMAEIQVTSDALRWPARIFGDKMCSFDVTGSEKTLLVTLYLYLTSNTKYFQSICIWPQILNTQSCQILFQILVKYFFEKNLSFRFKRGLIYHPSSKMLVILAFFMWGPNAWGKKASLATLHHLRKKVFDSIWIIFDYLKYSSIWPNTK